MPASRVRTYLAHKELLRVLRYDKRTGKFTWRVDRSRTARAGDEAGTLQANGTRQITIDGRVYMANRLAWFYVNGAFPTGQLTYYDSNPANLRWANIMLAAERFSNTPQARYHRDYRKRVAYHRNYMRNRLT